MPVGHNSNLDDSVMTDPSRLWVHPEKRLRPVLSLVDQGLD